MEHIPGFKIVGSASPEDKENITQSHIDLLLSNKENIEDEQKELFAKYEIEKTVEHIQYINAANQETNRLLVELGLKPYDIPYDNYHILTQDVHGEDVSDDTIHAGRAEYHNQHIIIYDGLSSIQCALAILHETLHLKSVFVLEARQIGDIHNHEVVTSNRRRGVEMDKPSHKGEGTSFSGLHECIVATQEKKSAATFISLIPSLAHMPGTIEFVKSKPELYKSLLDLLASENIDVQDISEVVIHDFEYASIATKENTFAQPFAYPEHTKTLQYICEELQQSFPEIYPTADAVFKEFLRAQFSGELLTLGSLMKSTFGSTGFRVLGEMSREAESAKETLEKLKTLRL